MVWVYDRTQSSACGDTHAHGSNCQRADPEFLRRFAETTGWPLLTFDLVWAAAVSIVVASVAMANRGQLSQQPLKT